MNVGNICSHTVVLVSPTTRVLDAARQMREAHVGALVVVEQEEGRTVPVGMLTDRDLVVTVLATDVTPLASLLVGDVLTRGVVTAGSNEDAMVVARRMKHHGVRRMPVVDEGGELCGVVTVDDLIAAVSAELAQIASLVSHQHQREAAIRR